MTQITFKRTALYSSIYIDGLLHLRLMDNAIVIHACIDDTNADIMYHIDWYLGSGHVVKSSYTRRDLWEAILKEIEYNEI